MKIHVVGEKDLPNGSVELDIEMDEEAVSMILKRYGADTLTNDLASKFVLEAIDYYIDKKETD